MPGCISECLEVGIVPLLDGGGGGGDAGPRFGGLPEPIGGPRLTPPECRPRDRDRVVMPDVAWVCGAIALPLSPGDFPDIYNVYCNYCSFFTKEQYNSGFESINLIVHLHSLTNI